MRNYYFTVTFLGILVISLVIAGFIVGGTPVSQRDLQLDKVRLNDFVKINYEIINYYQINKSLPQSLSALSNIVQDTKDPETNTTYVYTVESDTTYNLCTTFSTEVKTTQQYPDTGPTSSSGKTHKKGYDCIKYTIPQYLIRTSQPAYNIPTTPPITDAPITTQTQNGTSFMGTYTNPNFGLQEFMIEDFAGNTSRKVIYNKTTKLTNKNDEVLDIGSFVVGDKILVQSAKLNTTPYITAIFIKNLTR